MTRHNRAINTTINLTEKTAVGLFRWAATDHINKGRPIQFIPGTTFLGSLWNILMELFFGIFTAVLTGAIAYVMIAYGIPLLFDLMCWYAQIKTTARYSHLDPGTLLNAADAAANAAGMGMVAVR